MWASAARVRRDDLIRIGTDYGGWWIPEQLIDDSSICYLAGLGEDASFDLGLAQRFGCNVWSMDPTPRAIRYAAGLDHELFHFADVGVWSHDTRQRFYAPQNTEYVSHSLFADHHRSDRYFDADCQSLTTLMQRFEHDHIDLLKLDIEGAEEEVLNSLLAAGIRPNVICVELDVPQSLRRTRELLRDLARADYRAAKLDCKNWTFVLDGVR
ncbi:FkbM family methyltransferase [Agromyces archimandritae]|uniref:FkbM family methyltransferase n=1 Tax=Agromyces archimandritae TaxID=2781962 RepID=A0A975FP32_9MICO|nr:FkbM family methyltransferase [Agromyces archimandritae]QTX05427.1 FkbM family methyltransferase [Agromyces archimandritae]